MMSFRDQLAEDVNWKVYKALEKIMDEYPDIETDDLKEFLDDAVETFKDQYFMEG